MYFSFHPHAAHANGITDPILSVHHKLLWYDVYNLLIGREHDALAVFQQSLHILHRNFFVLIVDGDDALAADTADMITGNTNVYGVHLYAGRKLCLFHGFLDGVDGLVDVNHHTTVEPVARGFSHAENMDFILLVDRCNHGANLGCSDIKPDYNSFIFLFHKSPQAVR